MVKCGSCVHFPESGIKHFFALKWEKIKESIEIPILTRCCFCFPLRIGLLTFVYINLVLTVIATCFLSLYISYIRNASEADWIELQSEYKRLVFDIIGLVFELVFSVIFIAALYKKHVLLMKVYMYFEILYSIIGFIYSLAFLTKETVSELFLILFQMMLQLYLVILIWSLIVKMARDGSAKYIRENDPA